MQTKNIFTDPCPEDWSKMEDVSNGKFCAQCQKKVFDLTTVDHSVIEKDFLNKKVCVRMTEEQLDQIRLVHPTKRFLAALLLVFGTSLFKFSSAQDNKVVIVKTQEIEKCKVTGKVKYKGKRGCLSNYPVKIVTDVQAYSFVTDEHGKYEGFLPQGETILEVGSFYLNKKTENRKKISLPTLKIKPKKIRYLIGCPSF